jgi:hypothetical protein
MQYMSGQTQSRLKTHSVSLNSKLLEFHSGSLVTETTGVPQYTSSTSHCYAAVRDEIIRAVSERTDRITYTYANNLKSQS